MGYRNKVIQDATWAERLVRSSDRERPPTQRTRQRGTTAAQPPTAPKVPRERPPASVSHARLRPGDSIRVKRELRRGRRDHAVEAADRNDAESAVLPTVAGATTLPHLTPISSAPPMPSFLPQQKTRASELPGKFWPADPRQAPRSHGTGVAAHSGQLRLVFLDIDGVVHPAVPSIGGLFRPQQMELLRQLVERAGAQIVLSSAWRRDVRGRQAVSMALRKHAIPDFIARTAVTNGARRLEIRKWLAANEARVAGWVVLDDLPLCSAHPQMGGRGGPTDTDFAEHFVQTNPRTGLRPPNIKRALSILLGPEAAKSAAAALPNR
eukprot:SAG31_NODE_2494_length_5609_cov_3.188748_2_plen_323_part_00